MIRHDRHPKPRRAGSVILLRLALQSRPLQIALAAALLGLAGLVSGHLAIFADTTAYVRQGEYWANFLHLAAPLAPPPADSSATWLMPATVARRGEGAVVVAASRSPVYGLFLYLAAGLGTLKLVVALQALAVAWVLRVIARLAVPGAETLTYWVLIPILASGSSLPFFVDFAMPDVFSGLAILAAVIILVDDGAVRPVERGAIWLLMLFALLAHAANAPVVLLVALVGVGRLAWARLAPVVVAQRGGMVLAAVALSFLAAPLVQDAYHRATGFTQGTPPFVMARLLADGPGRAYLAATCPGGASPTLCRFRDRPLDDADAILWDGTTGVVGAADPATRRQLKAEEGAFVTAVLRFDPLGVARAAFANVVGQLLAVQVDDPLADPGRYRVRIGADIPAMEHLIPGLQPCRKSGGCQAIPTLRMVDLLFAVQAPVLLLSLAVVAWLGFISRIESRLREAGLLVLTALVVNAAVCGALSGVFARYQARMIWLLPMLAVLGTMAAWRARRDAAAESLTTGSAGARTRAPGAATPLRRAASPPRN